MNKRTLFFAMIALGFCMGGEAVQAALIFSDSFESPALGFDGAFTSQNMPGWTQTAGSAN